MPVRKIILFLILILLLQVVLRIPFLSEPLERDEGLYGYMAQRILAGEIPYRDAFDHKPPVIYYIYAVILKTCGQSILAIRAATLFYSLFTTLALFILATYLWGTSAGLIAALLAALFLHGPMIQGSNANCETFMILPMILALHCFIKGRREKKFYWMVGSGVLSGLAIMIKQVAALNYLALMGWGSMLGVGVVPTLFIGYFALNQALPQLYNCWITSNMIYMQYPLDAARATLWFGFSRTLAKAIVENSILWVLGMIAATSIIFQERNRENLLIIYWTALSLLGVALGRYYFSHYYIQVIPGLILLSSYALARSSARMKIILAIVILLLVIPILYKQLPFYCSYTPLQMMQGKYGANLWIASYEIGQDLRQTLKPGESIFVWDANPEIYYYLHVKSPSYYPYYLMWMGEVPKQRIITEVNKIIPKYILWTSFWVYDVNLTKFIQSYYKLNRNYSLLGSNLRWQLFERIGKI